MSKRSKSPALADFEISFLPGGGRPPMTWDTVRASRLRISRDSVVLEDAGGEPLFTAPASVTVVRPVPAEKPQDRKLRDPGLKGGDLVTAAKADG